MNVFIFGEVWLNTKGSMCCCVQAAAGADAASRSPVARSATVTTAVLSTANAARILKKSALQVRRF